MLIACVGGATPPDATRIEREPVAGFRAVPVGRQSPTLPAESGVGGAAQVAGLLLVNDAGDAGPGNCTGMCTLRDALAVVVSSGAVGFSASIVPGTITLTQGELAIAKTLSIVGPGAERIAISANSGGRIVNVSSGTVAISGVTLRDGSFAGGKGLSPSPGSASGGGNGDPAHGGCVFVAAGAALTLDRVDLRNCAAHGGAGGDGASGPDNSSTLNGPGVDGGNGGAGGGGSGGGAFVAGSLTLLHSSITSSAAYGGGGGHGGDGGFGGLAVLNGNGGNGGTGADGQGGCIYLASSASLWIENSTLANTHADGGSGGIGGTATSSSTSVHSGFGGNGGSARGGCLYSEAAAAIADVEFATLANGLLTPGSGGQQGVTINSASPGSPGSAGSASGYVVSTLTSINALSSVVAGSAVGALCAPANFTIGSGVVNLDQDSSCAGFTLHGTLAQSFKTFDPTPALPAFMPAYASGVIGAAANCKDLTAATVSDDEHGTPRPQGSQCDLGAIEADYIFVGTFD